MVVVFDPVASAKEKEEKEMQERKLKEHEMEIQRRKEEEEILRQEKERLQSELEMNEEARLVVEEKYSSMQEENDAKTRKLKKLFNKYKEAQNEITDLVEEFQQEREDYLNTIREMDKEMQICYMVIENFIPPEEVAKIRRRAFWDEVEHRWKISSIQYAGNNLRAKRPQSAVGRKRPVSEYARVAEVSTENPRFKDENIIKLDFDMPERTTTDYEINPVQEALDVAFQDNDEVMTFAASENLPNVWFSYPTEHQNQDMEGNFNSLNINGNSGAGSISSGNNVNVNNVNNPSSNSSMINNNNPNNAIAGSVGPSSSRPQSSARKKRSSSKAGSRPSSARSSASSTFSNSSSSSSVGGAASAGFEDDRYPTQRGLVGNQTRYV